MLEEGVHCTERGVPDFQRKKRQYYEDKRRSEKYEEDILNRSQAPDDDFSRHRPNNPSVDDLSSSEDEITPKRARMNANKRINCQRSDTSQGFKKIFAAASNAVFTVVANEGHGDKESRVRIQTNTGDVDVIIRKALYSSLCYPKYEGKRTINTYVRIV